MDGVVTVGVFIDDMAIIYSNIYAKNRKIKKYKSAMSEIGLAMNESKSNFQEILNKKKKNKRR